MLILSGKFEVQPSSVSQSSTLIWDGKPAKAELAIDGDMTTNSHTKCAWNTDLWYKMKFDATYCFSDVVIVQSHMQFQDTYYMRMEDTNVFVIDSNTGSESFCGVLKVGNIRTIKGQTYRIPCDLKCGDEVKLTVRHHSNKYQKKACIHMREITVFHAGWCFKFHSFKFRYH